MGFPQSGFKAGISDAAFPANWFAIVLRALGCQRGSLLGVRDDALISTSVRAVYRSTPGALAPVRVMLSRSIFTYSAPSAPLAGTSRLHRLAAYTRCPRCAYSHRPRRPTTGSMLSLGFLLDMPPSATPGSPSAASAQFFADDASLRRQFTGSALPSIPSSASDGEVISGLYYGSLSLRPIDLLASLADLTGFFFFPSQRRLLLPSFPRVGCPSLGRV